VIPTSGTRLGPYEILHPIGAGGMGDVYAARDTRLQRTVAIKICRDGFSARFEREARAVAALNHPNVCTLHDIGPDYLVMELVEGPTLSEVIASRTLTAIEAVRIARLIALALSAAHQQGIVHRDLKPANIKLTSHDVVKVLDFGLAKTLEADLRPDGPTLTGRADATAIGVVMGTVAYMSPEQAEGLAVDHRTDIWSLGVVLYQMLARRTPFDGGTSQRTILDILQEACARCPRHPAQAPENHRNVSAERPGVTIPVRGCAHRRPRHVCRRVESLRRWTGGRPQEPPSRDPCGAPVALAGGGRRVVMAAGAIEGVGASQRDS
jgi:serine/threonine protein kinase